MTYLYIKEHNVTGLRYFGKTKSDPSKYLGSGTYWKKHIAKHGKDIKTIWSKQFDDLVECEEFALAFSDLFDIVESNEWANLTIETSKDGRFDQAGAKNPMFGKSHTIESRLLISQSKIGLKQSPATIANRVAKTTGQKRPKQSLALSGKNNPNFGKPMSAETKAKMIATKLAKRLKETV
jgi:hypothetical protein